MTSDQVSLPEALDLARAGTRVEQVLDAKRQGRATHVARARQPLPPVRIGHSLRALASHGPLAAVAEPLAHGVTELLRLEPRYVHSGPFARSVRPLVAVDTETLAGRIEPTLGLSGVLGAARRGLVDEAVALVVERRTELAVHQSHVRSAGRG